MERATPEKPVYSKTQDMAGKFWMITCDEGWRSSIVCTGMYEWSADWMLEVLHDRPFAPNHRPGGSQ